MIIDYSPGKSPRFKTVNGGDMNVLEYDILADLKDRYGAFEIKAEFEAEGSRMEEMMRLKDVTSRIGLPLILKIGGVEAVTDVYNALSIGVKGLVAPMAETAFAVSKFTNLIDQYIARDNAADIEFAINVETITAFHNLDAILTCAGIDHLSGITIGRVDLVGSMGLDRTAINTSSEVFDIVRAIAAKARHAGLKVGMGGGIDTDALPVIDRLNGDGLLDKYETRKVVFQADSARHGPAALLTAIKFELLWLKSKRRYYSGIRSEDERRIDMLERRLSVE
jgi:hypothetical protein